MNSIEGKELFEIADLKGRPITAPYQSRKSLDATIKIAKRFDPQYHEKYKVRVFKQVLVGVEDIEPPRVCEDCESPSHIEGSEACYVSYANLEVDKNENVVAKYRKEFE